MKKFTSTDLGGAPIFKDDLRTIFNTEPWKVIQAMLSPFDADVEGLVISGCVTTANASNFDMTAGIVYLNGEFMEIAAVTNQSFTKYIQPSTVVNDDRTFEDGTVNTVAVTKGAQLGGSAPGAGQYIAIASILASSNRRIERIYIPEVEKTITSTSGGGTQTIMTIPHIIGKVFIVEVTYHALWVSGGSGATGNGHVAKKTISVDSSGGSSNSLGVDTIISHITGTDVLSFDLTLAGSNITMSVTPSSGVTVRAKASARVLIL